MADTKILYEPKEGTTGFWFNGVEIVNIHDHRAVLQLSHDGIDYFIGEEKHGTVTIPTKKLRDGDLLDIPIGYEFKSYKKCQHNGIHNSTCIYHEVLRLVKTETKQPEKTALDFLIANGIIRQLDDRIESVQCNYLGLIHVMNEYAVYYKNRIPQPEPEESQTLYTIDQVKEILHNHHCDHFKIPRDTVFPEPNWSSEWVRKNLIKSKKQ